MADVRAQWQSRLDKEFPQGAVASWVRPPTPGVHPALYRVPWVEVTAMAGLDPVLTMTAYGTGDKVLGPWHVVHYEVINEDPLMARITFEGAPEQMVLTSAVGDRLAEMMAQDRAEQQASPHPESSWTIPFAESRGGARSGAGTGVV